MLRLIICWWCLAAGSAMAELMSDAKAQDLAKVTIEDPQKGNYLTTNFGTRINHTDDSLKAGPRGPTLMEDFWFRERTTHFDHERIPERVVHARGSGAHGYFQVYENLEQYTKAAFLCNTSKKTPVFVRFSTVLGNKGSADTARDVRGFAVKFFTDEGNFDLVGNNIPVFFIQDAIKFQDVIHAGKPEPDNEMPQAATAHDNAWDFFSLTPETTHMMMWSMSDRFIPRSYRMMEGFGVHSFILTNKEGKRRFVKFHWKPLLGVHSLVWDEAHKLMGIDSDFHRRDLWESIESGAYPEYELGLQIVEEEDENKFPFDILDSTKIIPEELVPVMRVGKMVLNRNPDNFFAETEQVAFHTGHLVPGIEASNDPLLQGRMFSYVDTQITRLGGPNFEQLPINRPIVPVTNHQRDGMHQMRIDKGKVNYHPNRFGCPALASAAEHGYITSPQPVAGVKIRERGPKFYEHYSQARLFYNSLSDWEQEHLVQAFKFELGKVMDQGVRDRIVDKINHVDFDLAVKVANGIGVQPPSQSKAATTQDKSPALSQANTVMNTIQSRQIALLIAPGFRAAQYQSITAMLSGSGAVPKAVATYIGDVVGDNPAAPVKATKSILTAKSVEFDAVIIVGGAQSINTLRDDGDALTFITEAFKHGKAIVGVDEGVDLLAMLRLPNVKLAQAGGADDFVYDQGVVTARNLADQAMSMGDGPLNFAKAVYNSIAVHRHHTRDIKKVLG